MSERPKTNDIERRYVPTTSLRATDENGQRHIAGYAAVFNSLSENLGGFREKIEPGCFARACKQNDVRALWNHNPDKVLGRTSSGTLTLSEDEHGLKIDCIAPKSAVRELEAIERGDVSQMSFGFRTINDRWEVINGEDVRTLLDVELLDVSPVAFPAYAATEVGVRNLDVALRSMQEWKEKNTGSESEDLTYKTDIMKRRLEVKNKENGGL